MTCFFYHKTFICFVLPLYLCGCNMNKENKTATQPAEADITSFSTDIFREIWINEQPSPKNLGQVKQIKTYKWIQEDDNSETEKKEVEGLLFKQEPTVVIYTKSGKKLKETHSYYSWEMFYHYNDDDNLICKTVRYPTYTIYEYTIFDSELLPTNRVKYTVSKEGEIKFDHFESISYEIEIERCIIKSSEYNDEYILDSKTSKTYDRQMRMLEWDRDLQYTKMNTRWTYEKNHITEKNNKENQANFRYEKTLNKDGSLNTVKQFDDDDECRNITTYHYHEDKTEITSQNYSNNQSYKGDYTQEVIDKNGLILL